jgi:hypothetical protein
MPYLENKSLVLWRKPAAAAAAAVVVVVVVIVVVVVMASFIHDKHECQIVVTCWHC